MKSIESIENDKAFAQGVKDLGIAAQRIATVLEKAWALVEKKLAEDERRESQRFSTPGPRP